jgi:very-short-patch-repair endonuclease
MYTYQYYRDNPQEFKKYKGKDLIPFNCSACGKLYHKTQRTSRQFIFKGYGLGYCDNRCQNSAKNTSVSEPCKHCGITVIRTLSERKSVKNVFCNNSCAAKYNNAHKQYGTRRSKFEIHLEEFIRKEYPNLELLCNRTEAIESELDFYFPELRFAIELNGIVHYEPIYGKDKFERIQNNDKQKSIRCYERGIELAVIDISKISYLTNKIKDEYSNIIKLLLEQVMQRKNGTV